MGNNISLNDGTDCPPIGIATSCIDPDDLENIIYNSILGGIRLIDIDPANEEAVGNAIRRAINLNVVKRKDLFIVAKLDIGEKENPKQALSNSLNRLGLDYVDLYLDHWPSCKNYNDKNKYKLISVKETWEKMEKLVNKDFIRGSTRSIGVCNYNVENLLNIISSCKIKPVVNEVEFHPYLFQKDLKEFCELENIKIFAYNPLAKDFYSHQKDVLENNIDFYLEAPLNYLAHKNSKTRTQIILSWHKKLGIIPLPGMKLKKVIEIVEDGKPVTREKTDKEIENDILKKIEEIKNDDFKMDDKYKEILCSFIEKQYRFNDGSDIFGINIFA